MSGQNFTRNFNDPVANDASQTYGSSFFDYDNDGDVDLYISNFTLTQNLLYENDGSGNFTQILGLPITNSYKSSLGISWVDYDLDCDRDLYISNGGVDGYQQNQIFEFDQGSYIEITSGDIPDNIGNSQSSNWGDFDNDGDLDLFVANLANENNFLFQNEGGGVFTSITSGPIVTSNGQSNDANWIDYNNDGYLDLFVANQANQKNFLFKNEGGVFTQIFTGSIVNDQEASFGSVWGDYDNDGDFDLYVCNSGDQANSLYRNDGNDDFSLVTTGAQSTDAFQSYGGAFVDYDNDGFLDIFVSNNNGQNNCLYHNDGDGTFTKILNESIVSDGGISRGCNWADIDNDGDLDCFVANRSFINNFLYINDVGNLNNWVNISLESSTSNTDCIGAIVKIKTIINGSPVWQMRHVASKAGYCSQESPNIEFGLGDAASIDSVIVSWPTSNTQCIYTNIEANQFLTFYESCDEHNYGLNFTEIVCSGTNVSLTPDGNQLQWYADSSGINLIFEGNTFELENVLTDTTVYFIDTTCGAEINSISVNVISYDELISGDTEYSACSNQPFSPDLTGNLSGNTYLWEPPTGLSDPTILNPEITTTEPINYTLTASNPCAENATFELSVTLAEPLDFVLIPELTICEGDTIEIPGQLNSEADIAWMNSNTLSSHNIPNPLAFPINNTDYQVSVSNQCETIDQSIQVFVNQAPHISGIANLDICVGDTAFANIQNTGNFEVASWIWTPAVGLTNSMISNPGIFNENDITYQIQATNSCGSDLFEVQLSTYHLETVLDLDSIICPGEPINLSAQGAASYLWFPTELMDRPHDSITTAHIYNDQLIQLQLSGGTCVKTLSDFVQVYNNIGFTQLDAVHLYPGEYYDLSPIELLYNIDFSGPDQVKFDADTIVSLQYIDRNGCAFFLNLPILIEPALYIPNGFTPDGDGLNDIFKAIGVNIKNFEMRIYNRWGQLVFQTRSLNDGWNGGLNGYYCPDDIYNYIVEYSYHTTELKVKRGFVTLMR